MQPILVIHCCRPFLTTYLISHQSAPHQLHMVMFALCTRANKNVESYIISDHGDCRSAWSVRRSLYKEEWNKQHKLETTTNDCTDNNTQNELSVVGVHKSTWWETHGMAIVQSRRHVALQWRQLKQQCEHKNVINLCVKYSPVVLIFVDDERNKIICESARRRPVSRAQSHFLSVSPCNWSIGTTIE